MISLGRFHVDLNDIHSLLSNVKLLKERNLSERPLLGAADLAHLDYREQWEVIVKKNNYDFRLTDESLLSFVHDTNEGGGYRYQWLESPKKILSLEEFARTYIYDVCDLPAGEVMDDDIYNAMSREYQYDIEIAYGFYVDESPFKRYVTPLRYEFHPSGYKRGWHPVSHLHIGLNGDVRIACRHVLTPFAFVLFVVRQMFCEKWRALLASEWAATNVLKVREIGVIPDQYFHEWDQIELRLE